MPRNDPNELLKCRLNETGMETVYRRVIAERLADRGVCTILGTKGADPRPKPWEAANRDDLVRRAEHLGIHVTSRTSRKALWEKIEEAEAEAADQAERERAGAGGEQGDPPDDTE